ASISTTRPLRARPGRHTSSATRRRRPRPTRSGRRWRPGCARDRADATACVVSCGVLDALRTRVDRGLLFARALRSAITFELVRPAQLAEFARNASRVPPGPHRVLLFHAAAHPDREALIEYAAAGVRRLTWSQLSATTNRLANALAARGVGGDSRVALML